MKKNNTKLNVLRNLYLDSNEFVIMIRDESNDINKNTKKDIVYYNGIKALEIEKKDNEIKDIIIKDNIYKINTTNVKNNSKEDIINSIREVRKSIKDYLSFNLKRIEFQMSSNIHLFDDAFNKFKNEINEYIEKGYTDCNIKNKLTGQNKDTKVYYIEFNVNNKVIGDVLTEDILAEILEIEYCFIKNFKINEKKEEPYIVKKINFVYEKSKFVSNKKNNIFEESANIKLCVEKINNFNNSIKKSIKEYEKLTKEELEKKYQHHFMISKNTLGKLDFLKNLYRFEEEYYTDESNSKEEDRGRVDCVFLKVDKDILTDIYLIELKVNESVVGKSNGIHKHLIDVEKLLSNEVKKHNFIEKLYERVNFRRKIEETTPLKELKKEERKDFYNKINFHFYTIISFTENTLENSNKIDFVKLRKHVKEVTRLLKDFDNEKYITNNKLSEENKNEKSQKLPYGSDVLKKHMCRLNDIYKCDTRIYYDLYWDKKDIDSKCLYQVYYKNNLIDKQLEESFEEYIKSLEMDNYE